MRPRPLSNLKGLNKKFLCSTSTIVVPRRLGSELWARWSPSPRVTDLPNPTGHNRWLRIYRTLRVGCPGRPSFRRVGGNVASFREQGTSGITIARSAVCGPRQSQARLSINGAWGANKFERRKENKQKKTNEDIAESPYSICLPNPTSIISSEPWSHLCESVLSDTMIHMMHGY